MPEPARGGEPPSRRRVALRVGFALLGLAGLCGLGIGVWEGWLEDRLIPKRFGVVEEGRIYRSGRLSAALVRDVLEEHGIGLVVDLTGGGPGDDARAERRAVEELGIERVELGLRGDGTGDPARYVEAVEAMHESTPERPVLVHCAAGAQRTGGAVALYRLLVQGRDPQEVVDEMARYDWDPAEDHDLPRFLNRHLPEIARGLAARGVIDSMPEPLPELPVEE